MKNPNQGNLEPMSAAVASEYVRTMIHRESAGPGDCERAMMKLEAKYGLGFWTLDHLRKRKAKTCDVALFARIKAAFVDHCGSQAARLIQEAETAQAVNFDDDVAAIQDEIYALQARLADAKNNSKRPAR